MLQDIGRLWKEVDRFSEYDTIKIPRARALLDDFLICLAALLYTRIEKVQRLLIFLKRRCKLATSATLSSHRSNLQKQKTMQIGAAFQKSGLIVSQ